VDRHFPDAPVILKPNRGGKGLGVRLFHTAAALGSYIAGAEYDRRSTAFTCCSNTFARPTG
jgi:hypothetical protein